MKRLLFFAGVIFALSLTGFAAQAGYQPYQNARFGYSILYPADLLTPQGEADNGDGQIFKNADAEMRVYGSNMVLGETLAGEYRRVLKEHGSVTYKTLGKKFFVVSGTSGGVIFYRKTFENREGAYITFEIEYPAARRAVYDKVVARVVKSFRV